MFSNHTTFFMSQFWWGDGNNTYTSQLLQTIPVGTLLTTEQHDCNDSETILQH